LSDTPSLMPAAVIARPSARPLTLAAYACFVPIGIATILLGPMLPILSARWSMTYSEAGRLFPVQYIAATAGVAASGWLVSRRGFRFAIRIGLLLLAAGLALLLAGSKLLALFCIAGYGVGLGIAVPAANLLVAELNPDRRSATLNWLNFWWSAGAVSCPFLVAAAAKSHRLPQFLGAVSGLSLLVFAIFVAVPGTTVQSKDNHDKKLEIVPLIRRSLSSFLALAALFFIYVGSENSFGGWVASYAKNLDNLTPAMAALTPAFFYAALTVGRSLAPALLREVDDVKLAQAGVLLGVAGTAGLVFSSGLIGVAVSACAAGLGFSSVYPISIALLSREFGSASSRIGSVMFTLSNLGGGLLPWVVGVYSTRFGTLKAGLLVPLLGSIVMFAILLGKWARPEAPSVKQI